MLLVEVVFERSVDAYVQNLQFGGIPCHYKLGLDKD
jgi:hypothetical protein